MKRVKVWPIVVGIVVLSFVRSPNLARSQTVSWIRQLGSIALDYSTGVSADGLGNVYISGWTDGSLNGSNQGGNDAFISKYDSSGHLLWAHQLGSSEDDKSFGVSADGLGNVYISGYTTGSLDGLNYGGTFLTKYDASGNRQWTRQLRGGTGRSVSADGLGNVYISGDTGGSLGGPNQGSFDAFISKYDASGNLKRFAAIAPICGGGETYWTKQLVHLPVWAFHGAKDPGVPLERSQVMVDALKRNGGDAKLTVYPEAGHDAWTETYDNPQFYDWLLAHKRSK